MIGFQNIEYIEFFYKFYKNEKTTVKCDLTSKYLICLPNHIFSVHLLPKYRFSKMKKHLEKNTTIILR